MEKLLIDLRDFTDYFNSSGKETYTKQEILDCLNILSISNIFVGDYITYKDKFDWRHIGQVVEIINLETCAFKINRVHYMSDNYYFETKIQENIRILKKHDRGYVKASDFTVGQRVYEWDFNTNSQNGITIIGVLENSCLFKNDNGGTHEVPLKKIFKSERHFDLGEEEKEKHKYYS